jgi:hypothetical protein
LGFSSAGQLLAQREKKLTKKKAVNIPLKNDNLKREAVSVASFKKSKK